VVPLGFKMYINIGQSHGDFSNCRPTKY